jgi:hypothetical protein
MGWGGVQPAIGIIRSSRTAMGILCQLRRIRLYIIVKDMGKGRGPIGMV